MKPPTPGYHLKNLDPLKVQVSVYPKHTEDIFGSDWSDHLQMWSETHVTTLSPSVNAAR